MTSDSFDFDEFLRYCRKFMMETHREISVINNCVYHKNMPDMYPITKNYIYLLERLAENPNFLTKEQKSTANVYSINLNIKIKRKEL